jgi:alpha-beta hydrolase superfamily lysophospholipase
MGEKYQKMTDGFNLFFRHWKNSSTTRKAVVCIHGMGGHSGMFKPLADSLASKGIEVYGLDLRGFGNSKEANLPRGDTKDFLRHLEDLDEMVRIIRNKFPHQKIFLLGHSLGSCYVLWYAATHPDSLDGLVLAAPAIDVKPKVGLKERAKFPFLLLNAPATMINTEAALIDQNGDAAKALIQDPLFTRTFSVRWLFGIGSTLMGDKAFQNAAQVKKPTLILQGQADTDAFPDGAKRLYDALSAEDKILKLFPGADHGLYNVILRLWPSVEDLKRKEQLLLTISNWLETH